MMSKLVSWFLVNEVQTLPTELSMSNVNKLEFCVIWYSVLHARYKQIQKQQKRLRFSGFVLFWVLATSDNLAQVTQPG